MSPQRVQLSRRAGFRKPDGAVVVARPSKWGNPFQVGAEVQITRTTYVRGRGYTGCMDFGADGELLWEGGATTTITPALAVEMFRTQLLENLADDDLELDPVRAAIAELRGRDLACWCPLALPCHADVLLEVANW